MREVSTEGGAPGGGGADGVQSQRTALHTVSMSPKHFLRITYLKISEPKLKPAGHYPFTPVFEDEKSKGQKQNRSSKKQHKKANRTNIIATNFVCN